MFSKFFIDRPILSTVISIVIVLAGIAAIRNLPIEQYPQVVPPQVSVKAYYPGASAETIAKTVAAPLEQSINGVENMIYMDSVSSASGTFNLTISFEIGTDPDEATINVNNRVQQTMSQLPLIVQKQGITVQKESPNIVQVISLYAKENRYDTVYISNYALINIIDELKRLPGVGNVELFGRKNYSMRVWIEPDKLAMYNLTALDVAKAINEQNNQFAAGSFGEEPMSNPQAFTYTVTTEGRFSSAEEFGEIILKTNPDGSTLKIKDIATVELGSQNYNFSAKYNGQDSVPIGIFLQPGANALEVAKSVVETMDKLSERFPEGLLYALPYDTTTFVKISINEVIKTFIEAMVLVVVVVFLFLQKAKATLIPILAVPVSIVGAFAGMYIFGFSINLLTLFGLVLAIGMVVDDAIIVVENAERIMEREKIPAKEATIKAMKEVTGPLIAIVLVLSAVFIPVAFIGGFSGEMYKQFAITIVVSIVISGLVALTLTPTLCAIFLKHKKEENKPLPIFKKFNDLFEAFTNLYIKSVRWIIKHWLINLASFITIIVLSALVLIKIPSSLVPQEDQGSIFVLDYLPPAASLSRTQKVREKMDSMMLNNPNIEHVVSFAGYDLLTSSLKTSAGTSFVTLKHWDERPGDENSAESLINRLNREFYMGIDEGIAFAVNMPPIMGLSTTGGFDLYIQDRNGMGSIELEKYANIFMEALSKRPEIAPGIQSTFNTSTPQYNIMLDRDKAKALNVSISELFDTMQATFGRLYVNDFNLFGRTFQVNISSKDIFREKPEDMNRVFVKSQSGEMIPLTNLVKFERIVGPDTIRRFNLFQVAHVMGSPAPGYSSGQALKAVEEVAKEVLEPRGYTIAWSGTAYQEKAASGTGSQAFIFGVILVFLILAAQYERWILPLGVVAAIPFAVLGATLAVYMRGLDNDIYFQVGLLVLIGLTAKNAILIIEFATQKRKEGFTIVDAAIEGSKIRLRPIIMTSLAFTIGALPLAISTGAGAASRHAIGTGVVGGMIAATFLATPFIPMFYVWLEKLNEKIHKRGNKEVSNV